VPSRKASGSPGAVRCRPVIAGFAASALSAAAVPLNAKNLAKFDFSQAGRYDVVGRKLRVLAIRCGAPSEDEIMALIDELARVKEDKVEEAV
jgi:hypothetical protein